MCLSTRQNSDISCIFLKYSLNKFQYIVFRMNLGFIVYTFQLCLLCYYFLSGGCTSQCGFFARKSFQRHRVENVFGGRWPTTFAGIVCKYSLQKYNIFQNLFFYSDAADKTRDMLNTLCPPLKQCYSMTCHIMNYIFTYLFYRCIFKGNIVMLSRQIQINSCYFLLMCVAFWKRQQNLLVCFGDQIRHNFIEKNSKFEFLLCYSY